MLVLTMKETRFLDTYNVSLKPKKILVIIQARTDSNRFPNKVLSLILGKPLLWHVINRTKQIKHDRIVVVTTRRKIDNKIVEIARNSGVDCFRGKTYDVLDRFFNAAIKYQADIIVRITADCPLIDPTISNMIIDKYLESGYDYVATDEQTFPKGVDTECFSFTALKKAWKKAKSKLEKEHVTPYIWKNPKKFRIHILINKRKEPYRLVVDYENDLRLIRKIYSKLYKKNKLFSICDTVNMLKKEPHLLKINEGYEPHEVI